MDRAHVQREPDFRNIRPLSGRQSEGFEELCCQIALRTPDVPPRSRFQRNYGPGGDAGVECFYTLPDGSQWAWQAKYFFELGDAQRRQLTGSVEAALTNYPSLVLYTICLPFDLTGRTGRRAGQDETYRRLQERWEARARELGREVEFLRQGKSELLDALLAIDRDGARRRFWFGDEILTPDWFDRHLNGVEQAAGPRYSSHLSVDVPLAKAFEALGKTEVWRASEQDRLDAMACARDRWVEARTAPDWDHPNLGFPQSAADIATELTTRLAALVKCLSNDDEPDWADELRRLIQETRDVVATCEYALAEDLERTHGPGTADSVSFRQFQAEVGRSFPARFLDATRELIRSLDDLAAWTRGPEPSLPTAPAMLVYGSAGTGKTHAVCDTAMDRQRRGLHSVVIFGEQLHDGEPWNQIRLLLGFGADVSRDLLLGMLDVAGETSGYPLIVFIDALNETTPRNVWKRFLAPMLAQARRFPWLKVCISCRTSYLGVVLPEPFEMVKIEHAGFAGVEFEAFTEFFDYYGITSPETPLLQPEFANPLFLRLVCEALQASEDRRIPDTQLGFEQVVVLLLEDKNRRVSEALDHDAREQLVPRAIRQLASTMAREDTRQLPWSIARAVVDEVGPRGARAQSLFHRLIGEGLLVEDRVFDPETGAMQDVVRIAFERLADFLIAEQMLDGLDAASVREAFAPAGRLHFALSDHAAVATRFGLLEALAILLPERYGLELTEVLVDEELIADVRPIVCASLLWRSPESITEQASIELREAVQSEGSFSTGMDALLALSTRPDHPLNARWGHKVLSDVAMPDRDAVLCPYLHYAWGAHGGVDRLVRWALNGDLANLGEETAELWATQLAWFLAANDRRVRDHATKAIVRLLDRHPARCASVLARFTAVDDDYVVERCLAACYGVLLRRRDGGAVRAAAAILWERWFQPRRLPQSALVRDYARLVMELALDHDVLPTGVTPQAFRPPYASEWPPNVPRKMDIERYEKQSQDYPRLYWSCLEDDFLRYTIVGAFGGYESLAPIQAGVWILQHVVDMGYTPERFAGFDREMIRAYGPGRGRPEWAERIGKKYQWIALYRLKARAADHLGAGDAASGNGHLRDAPLQAVGQRNIDPSHWLSPSVATEPSYLELAPDFAAAGHLSDEEWLCQGALPDTRSLLLTPRPYQGTLVLPMSANFRFKSKPAEDGMRGHAFRALTIHLSSYLVPTQGLEACLAGLKAMRIGAHSPPEAESLNPTFLGEYPTTVEARRTLALQAWHPESFGYVPGLAPAEFRIVNGFELDAFTGKALSIRVPAPVFFERGRLEWDGRTGFLDADGRTAFFNPSTDGWDPVSFVVSFDYLRDFLRESQLCAVWLEQVMRTAVADKPPGRLYIDIVRCHVFDGETVDTVIERTIDAQLIDPDSNGNGQDDAEE